MWTCAVNKPCLIRHPLVPHRELGWYQSCNLSWSIPSSQMFPSKHSCMMFLQWVVQEPSSRRSVVHPMCPRCSCPPPQHLSDQSSNKRQIQWDQANWSRPAALQHCWFQPAINTCLINLKQRGTKVKLTSPTPSPYDWQVATASS